MAVSLPSLLRATKEDYRMTLLSWLNPRIKIKGKDQLWDSEGLISKAPLSPVSLGISIPSSPQVWCHLHSVLWGVSP